MTTESPSGPDFVRVVAEMSSETFAEVIQTSPRKIRETLFGRLGIKAKKTVGLRVHGKLEDRTKKLHEKLAAAETKQERDLCEELVRNWLYTKRTLLVDTLDFLGVKHENGLVDEEPTFFQELTKERVVDLVAHLEKKGHPREVVVVYLTFVRTPHLDALAAKAA
jgi:hypothetical protein